MDEQTIQQPIASPEPEAASIPTPQPKLSDEIVTRDEMPVMSNGREAEVGISEETGEVKFGENFFDDLPPDDESTPEAPRYYSMEELRNTPYERWDMTRLPEQLRDYAQIVGEQLNARRIQQQIAQRPATPPFLSQPKSYTPKELSEAAQRIAVQRLGLDDPEDFDDYEPEHRAALNLAMNELVQNNQRAQENYQRIAGEYRQLQAMNAELVTRPDYREFDAWFDGKLKSMNVTPQQLDAYLTEFARKNNGNYGAIRNMVSGWYQEFQREKQSRSRVSMPPMMESTQGAPIDTRSGMNLRGLRDMDTDGQAAMLMRLGFV